MERLSTGISGLDEHLEGGFPIPSLVFVKGTPGAGKTTLGVQYLFSGIGKQETGIYITGVSEPVHLMKKFLSVFDFYSEAPIKDGRIQFWDLGETLLQKGPEGSLEALRQIIKAHKPVRVVIDPLPPSYFIQDQRQYREFLVGFFNALRSQNTVTLVIGEKEAPDASGLEEYMADGVISLDITNIEGNPMIFRNILRIAKMRGTHHSRNCLGVEITRKGMKVERLV